MEIIFPAERPYQVGWNAFLLNEQCRYRPPSMFVVMNNSLTHGAVISSKNIIASPVVEVKNTTVPIGESFYDVPVSNIKVINLLSSNFSNW